jgi:glycosyltransferase involved in cell wall biosynthesis
MSTVTASSARSGGAGETPGGAAPEAARGRVVIVMPAYNAAKTLEDTFRAIPSGWYDEIVVVDDHSRDETTDLARRLNLKAIRHPHNVGYGGNQKTCYMEALRDGADIVVMLHPDGQYDPAIIPEMIRPIREARADMVLGSRMMIPGGAVRGGMPLWKRIANRFLTTVENLAMRRRFTECHTGYRAYSRRFLETVPFLRNSNGFVFDTEVIFQAVQFGLPVVEVPISTRYFADASSVGFRTGVVYGLGTLMTAARFLLHRWGIVDCDKFRR